MSTPAYRYKISIDGQEHLFREVSGLEVHCDTVEYRNNMEVVLQPTETFAVTASLRHGSVEGYKALYDWMDAVRRKEFERKDVTIALLDESLSPAVTWTIVRAFPSKLTSLVYAEGSDQAVIGELVLRGDSPLAHFPV